jgi:hypothetical protein
MQVKATNDNTKSGKNLKNYLNLCLRCVKILHGNFN